MSTLLDPQFLAQLEYLSIVAKEGFLGGASAAHTSRRHGSAMEYADYRDYAPGDDFRYIDWKVYARLDRLVIKLFTEEEELAIYLACDVSASMEQGEPQKLLYAKKLLAVLGYIGLCNLDRVTVIPFHHDMAATSPTISGRGRRLELLRFLEELKPAGKTDMYRAVKQFVAHYKKRGLVVLASDFFDPSYAVAMRLLHHNGFDLLSLQVNDRSEVEPGFKGDLELVDCESGQTVNARLTPAAKEIYAEEWTKHYAELNRLSRAFDQGHYSIVSDTKLEDTVRDVFRRSRFLR